MFIFAGNAQLAQKVGRLHSMKQQVTAVMKDRQAMKAAAKEYERLLKIVSFLNHAITSPAV